ncbi:MAG: PEP-utilizing enzyme [Bacillus subtilis]|nr:PEP-utilizing enzyme [Bacillus subtilis]
METSPEDIEGMVVASGILTARGGMTSHAAVVARGMGPLLRRRRRRNRRQRRSEILLCPRQKIL